MILIESIGLPKKECQAEAFLTDFFSQHFAWHFSVTHES